MKRRRRERGITIIGLVITIIVILVLAGITISTMQGNSGIISKADESKSQTERKEVIEKAKMTISENVVNNGGNELTRSELKEILEQYFINVPEDYTLETILKTKEENGKYEIKVSEIYDRDIMTENEETDGSTEVVPPTSSTNVENGNSGNIGSGGNTGNNGNTGNGGSNSTEIDVTKVEMDKQTATVDINGENTVQLNAKVIPSNANKNTEITWTSKKKKVASVNQKGLVTGKTVGNSMIMATSQNGYSAECLVVCQAKITGITVSPTTANIQVGQKIQLTAVTIPETVTEKMTWKSRNEDVAKVDNNGNVTGIGKGVVEIIAQNPGGTIQAVCLITVQAEPVEIRLNYSVLVIDINSTDIPKLEAMVIPNTANVNANITWKSSDPSIVEVDGGNVIPIKNGNAVITARTDNGIEATCDIIVQTSPLGVTLSKNKITLDMSGTKTAQLIATINPYTANVNKDITWTSSNTDIAEVEDGLVTGISNGTVVITAMTANGKYAECIVKVQTSPTEVKLNYSSLILEKNALASPTLNATILPESANVNTNITWSSSNTSVVAVDNGKLAVKGNGSTTITVKTDNGCRSQCTIVIITSITSIEVSPTSKKMEVNQTAQLTATVNPADATEKITWKSSNTDVAKVDRNGLVTGVAKGKAIITAQNPAGTIKATCTVTVGNATLMVASSGTDKDTDNYLRSNVAKNKIESIKFVKGQVPTSGIIEQFDASADNDNSIIGYYTDEDGNGMYELTISSEAKIEANSNSSQLFRELSKVKEITFENFDTSNVKTMRMMFFTCYSLSSLDVSKFNTSQVTDMAYMFGSCRNLSNIDVSKFNTSQVRNMSFMFTVCNNLINIDVSKFNTSQVTNMRNMFSGCISLNSLDVSKFNTSNVTNMAQMFYECSNLSSLDVSNFDTSKVTNMSHMFTYCNNVTSLDVSKFNTSNVTSMSFMFDKCSNLSSLDVSKFDTSKVTDMSDMFLGCTSLASLNVSNFNTSKVTDMRAMFDKCSNLSSLDVSKFDTSLVTDMSSMFASCTNLTTIYVSEYNKTTGKGWTTKNVTDSRDMFYATTKLVGGNGTTYNSNYTDATYARIDKTRKKGYFTDIGQASKTESYVGYYADVDGDGTVDGIIFADLLHGKSGQWGDSNGIYTIPTKESTKVKSYKISQEDYTNQLGGTSKILTPSGEGEDRFYVMELTDIGISTYVLGCSMSGTTTTFRSGKINTQTLIGKADLSSSLKEQIQPKVNKGWFIPSKEEWSAFGEELGITRSNYSTKGLNNWYWSSSSRSIHNASDAWYAYFYGGYMGNDRISHGNYVRLATTF